MSEPILYVAPTEAHPNAAGQRVDEPTTYPVAPTQAFAEAKHGPATDRNWPHGSLTIDLPAECAPAEVGPRVIYRAPENLDANEISAWNAIQFQIQERLEGWESLPVTSPPEGGDIDVSSAETTREQLLAVMAAEEYCNHREALARMLKERATLEQQLLNWLWVSKLRTLERNVSAAESACRRVATARERLRREGPAGLHERRAELEQARRLAIHEKTDNGQTGGNKIDWLTEQIASIDRLPSMTSGERYDRECYQKELADRTETLKAIEAEIAAIESKLLDA